LNKTLIRLEHCSYTYEGASKPAVEDVSLSVREGQFLAVLGRNGSGKSTMAKLINGLYLPTSGDVWVGDKNTKREEDVWEIRSQAGMVFQNPDNQLVATIVEEDVAFGPENLGIAPEEIRRRVDEALKKVGMEKFAQSAPHRLSGGQKQRIAIAGMLAMRPKILIFDEATAMLDPMGRQEILQTALQLNREEGMTVLWITHFMEEAAQAQRLLVMHEGRAVLEGTPQEVFQDTGAVTALGLDVPPMASLAASLRRQGVELPGNLLTLDEMVEALCRLLSKT